MKDAPARCVVVGKVNGRNFICVSKSNYIDLSQMVFLNDLYIKFLIRLLNEKKDSHKT